MKVIIFGIGKDEKAFLSDQNNLTHALRFEKQQLNESTSFLVKGFDAVVVSHVDKVSHEVLKILSTLGIKFLASRSKGIDNIDMDAARKSGIKIANVPNYSSYSIAEHAIMLLLVVMRKFKQGQSLIKQGDFRLNGLLGFDLHAKPIGIIGFGKIGQALSEILTGFGCKISVYDPYFNENTNFPNIQFVDFDSIIKNKRVVFLSCPLTKQTRHLIGEKEFEKMDKNSILINTARGAVLDTKALLNALESNEIAGAGLDVIENEKEIFSRGDIPNTITDEIFIALNKLSNVVITAHQAFFTEEALQDRARITINNINEWETNGSCKNEILN